MVLCPLRFAVSSQVASAPAPLAQLSAPGARIQSSALPQPSFPISFQLPLPSTGASQLPLSITRQFPKEIVVTKRNVQPQMLITKGGV